MEQPIIHETTLSIIQAEHNYAETKAASEINEVDILTIVQQILQHINIQDTEYTNIIPDNILFRIMPDSILSPKKISPVAHLQLVNKARVQYKLEAHTEDDLTPLDPSIFDTPDTSEDDEPNNQFAINAISED